MPIRTHHSVAIFMLLAVGACKKPADPSYVGQIADAQKALCECTSRPEPERVPCMGEAGKRGSVHPKSGPAGEPPGVYEESLDDASKAEIERLRAQAQSCERAITSG